jgi:hypothetical protein
MRLLALTAIRAMAKGAKRSGVKLRSCCCLLEKNGVPMQSAAASNAE